MRIGGGVAFGYVRGRSSTPFDIGDERKGRILAQKESTIATRGGGGCNLFLGTREENRGHQ